MGLNLEAARRLCAGHNAANVVDTSCVVGSNGVGVSSIVGVGSVGDSSRGGSSLHLSSRGSNDVGTSGKVGVGAVGVRIAGVGDGRCGNNGGNNRLHVDVGLCDIAGDVMDVSLSCRGRSVSNITGGIVDIGESCRGIIDGNIASGIMDIGKSLRGLSALLRDGAGKSQGNGRQENLSRQIVKSELC